MSDPSVPSSRQLLILRHAKSSWSDPGANDFERTLNHRGRMAAPQVGRKLRQEKIDVDIVLASSAVRVRETLELLLPAWQYDGPVSWEKQLYLASPETLGQQIAALHSNWNRAMIVGHNPGLSQLASLLTGTPVDMPTAALVHLECTAVDWPSAIRQRDWKQLAFWKPKEL
jgi:phosphohistidine phosphatase